MADMETLLRTALTTAQVAERLGVSGETVRRAVNAGHLRPAYKFPGLHGIYLFTDEEVTRYSDRRTELDEALRRLNDAV